METIKRVLGELYNAVDSAEDSISYRNSVLNAIELLSIDETDYENHMVSEELNGILLNLQDMSMSSVEDTIYELEVMINEI